MRVGEVEQLADQIAADAPKPSHVAAKLEHGQADARDPRWASLRDKYGHAFDPTLHQANADGSPKLSRAGRLQGLPGRPLPRKGGSRVGQGPPSVSTAPPLGEVAGAGSGHRAESSAGDSGGDPSAELSAQVVVDSVTTACTFALGPEWQPRRERIGGRVFDERAQLIVALAKYFEATGVRDVPPGVLLGMTLSSYALPRLVGGTETRSRLARAWSKVRGWFRGLRRGARADRGADGEREIDAREAARDAA